MVGTLKGVRSGNFPFSCVCYFLVLCWHDTGDFAWRSSQANSGTRAVQKRLCEIKENNKHVRGIWTSAVTQALIARPWPFHESKHCCLGFPYIKQNQHLSGESEQWRWQVHRANDNTIAEMLATTVPPTLPKDCAFKHHHWTVKPLKPLSCPYCPFHFNLK